MTITYLKPLAHKLEQILNLKQFDENQFGEKAAREIRKIQTNSIFSLTSAMMFGNIVFAVLLTANLIGKGLVLNTIITVWCLSIVAISLATWRKSHLRQKQSMVHTGSKNSIENLFISSAFLSTIWCVPVIFFYNVSEGSERGIITAIMAGILSAGAVSLSRIPKIAYTWLLIAGTVHFLVAMFSGFYTSNFADFTIAIFSVFATIGLMAAVKERARSFFKAFADTQSIKEKSEVIDLLLKDYESQSTEWLWETNAKGVATRVPQQILDILGYDLATLQKATSPQLAREHSTEDSDENINRLMSLLSDRQEFHDITLSIKDARDGSIKWIMTRGKPQWDGDIFLGYRGICADATAAMEAEKNIHFMAKHDTLTGLSNRAVFNEQINRWNSSNRDYSIFLIDLDHFKAVNDISGHTVGDDVLVEVAKRLRKATKNAGLRRADECVVARFGGDEFSIAFANDRRSNRDSIAVKSEKLAQNIVELIAKPFMNKKKEIQIGASVGYVIAPEDGNEITRLINRADIALYRAKANGKSTYHRFNFEMDEENRSAKLLEVDVRNALQLGQLKIAYQPIVSISDIDIEDIDTPKEAGMEALLRWNHPTKGSIGPDVFIPIAEDTGSIIAIGEWVLKQACLEAVSWDNDMSIAVNVSVKQIIAPNFIHTVLGALATSGLEPKRLEIEMTESVLITDPELTISTIRQLRALGVRVSLDDFGTGYSSLSYIADFDVDRIKIDKSFVDKLSDKSANAAPVINAITDLAKSLGLLTVGEGVETKQQAEQLRELGCDHLQGFYYGKPEMRKNTISLTDDNIVTITKLEENKSSRSESTEKQQTNAKAS